LKLNADDTVDDVGGFEKYIEKMSKPGTWGDGVILAAAARLYQRSVIVITEDGKRITTEVSDRKANPVNPMYLGYIKGNHYVPLKPVISLPKHQTMRVLNDARAVAAPLSSSHDCKCCCAYTIFFFFFDQDNYASLMSQSSSVCSETNTTTSLCKE